MQVSRQRAAAASRLRMRLVLAAVWSALLPGLASGQGLTGTLIGKVTDEHGQAVAGARVRLSSPALIGSPSTIITTAGGQWRFPALPVGFYVLDVDLRQFSPYHEERIPIGGGGTIERTVALRVAGVAESVVVEGAGSRIDARDPGFKTRFGAEDLKAIPTRRDSMFDWIRAAPGISATSPSSGTVTTISAFGSGANENQFLIDGTNTTCPCNGVARSEPGVDFIQEVQVQSVGASVEFGNVQGAVINVITRQGSNRLLYDASYFGQPAALTSQPVRLLVPGPAAQETGYARSRYRDLTTNLGGPAVRDRLWFFGGYQYLRDNDSQPGTDPRLPRTYEQNKAFAKLTWRLAPSWQLVQSVHLERWVNSEQPTTARPFATTVRTRATVPAATFGHLTHTMSPNTLWDLRVGRFTFAQKGRPSTGDLLTPSRLDQPANILSGAPQQFTDLSLIRTTAKATVTLYRPHVLGADHQLKAGTQLERGEHESPIVIPTGVRYVYSNGQPSQSISSAPSNTGGVFMNAAGFVTDAVTLGDRVTLNAGVRFDHTRAISQDLHRIDLEGRETADVVPGLGTMYTWRLWSPRLGITTRVTGDGRTILRASYGRFYQGVLTGEIGPFHPGSTPVTTMGYVAADGGYTRPISTVSRANLRLDPGLRAPRTDEYSVGVDREVGRQLAVAMAYV
ncbi:MAG: TonB-dependent receptor, partial [Acidobacteriota bacterium]